MKLKLFEKMPVALLIIMMNGFGIFGIIESSAFFDDSNVSEKSSIGARLLSFSLDSNNDFHPDITPDSTSSKIFVLRNEQDLEIDYDIFISVNGGGLFCGELDLRMKRNGSLLYDGGLLDFSLFNLSLAVSESDNFELAAFLNDDSEFLWGKQCDFDLIFEGEQKGGGGFSDVKTLANSITSGVWDIPGGNSKPPVVINEIMWMGSMRDDGSRQDGDEWIELKNTTGRDINIGKWRIGNAKMNNKEYAIPANKIIPAGGYFLIANYPEQSANSNLNVSIDQSNAGIFLDDDYFANGQLVLKDSEGEIIDVSPNIGSGSWSEGVSGPFKKFSMARNSVIGAGSSAGNWHTCDRDNMTLENVLKIKSYFKRSAGCYNCGTPGYANIEEETGHASNAVFIVTELKGSSGKKDAPNNKFGSAGEEDKTDKDNDSIADSARSFTAVNNKNNEEEGNKDDEDGENESKEEESAGGKEGENAVEEENGDDGDNEVGAEEENAGDEGKKNDSEEENKEGGNESDDEKESEEPLGGGAGGQDAGKEEEAGGEDDDIKNDAEEENGGDENNGIGAEEENNEEENGNSENRMDYTEEENGDDGDNEVGAEEENTGDEGKKSDSEEENKEGGNESDDEKESEEPLGGGAGVQDAGKEEEAGGENKENEEGLNKENEEFENNE